MAKQSITSNLVNFRCNNLISFDTRIQQTKELLIMILQSYCSLRLHLVGRNCLSFESCSFTICTSLCIIFHSFLLFSYLCVDHKLLGESCIACVIIGYCALEIERNHLAWFLGRLQNGAMIRLNMNLQFTMVIPIVLIKSKMGLVHIHRRFENGYNFRSWHYSFA